MLGIFSLSIVCDEFLFLLIIIRKDINLLSLNEVLILLCYVIRSKLCYYLRDPFLPVRLSYLANCLTPDRTSVRLYFNCYYPKFEVTIIYVAIIVIKMSLNVYI